MNVPPIRMSSTLSTEWPNDRSCAENARTLCSSTVHVRVWVHAALCSSSTMYSSYHVWWAASLLNAPGLRDASPAGTGCNARGWLASTWAIVRNEECDYGVCMFEIRGTFKKKRMLERERESKRRETSKAHLVARVRLSWVLEIGVRPSGTIPAIRSSASHLNSATLSHKSKLVNNAVGGKRTRKHFLLLRCEDIDEVWT